MPLKHVKEGKNTLVVELNPFHGETLPGYVEYFQKLGYDVTVLTRYGSWKDSPFVQMEKKPRHYCLTLWGMRHFLKSRRSREFDVIFYNSFHLYLEEYRYYGYVNGFLGGEIPSGKGGWFCIEHHFDEAHKKYLSSLKPAEMQEILSHTFVLTPQKCGDYAVPMLNPCTFGTVCYAHKPFAGRRRRFVAIGNVSGKTRSFSLLFKTLKELDVDSSIEVRIIGRVLDKSVLNDLPSQVTVLGRLTFVEMYNGLEQADFFLPLLDPEAQPQYLDGCTSGSRQLILGFMIPPVIHQAFAKHYGFTDDSCLTYSSDDGFTTALKRALTMKDDEYVAQRQELARLAEGINQESLDNLKKRLVKS